MYKESTLKKQKVRRWKAGEVEPDRGLSVSVRSPQQKDSASRRELVVGLWLQRSARGLAFNIKPLTTSRLNRSEKCSGV